MATYRVLLVTFEEHLTPQAATCLTMLQDSGAPGILFANANTTVRLSYAKGHPLMRGPEDIRRLVNGFVDLCTNITEADRRCLRSLSSVRIVDSD